MVINKYYIACMSYVKHIYSYLQLKQKYTPHTWKYVYMYINLRVRRTNT